MDDKLTVRDPYGRDFEIVASARPFWEGHEGHRILDAPESAAAPAEADPAGASKAAAPGDLADPKTLKSKASARPAPEVKE